VNDRNDENRWGDDRMDRLETELRRLCAESGVRAADLSSILHWLASDADRTAVTEPEESESGAHQ
jgi:hypothetical protein